jgi:AcrR family transcriptional regulator
LAASYEPQGAALPRTVPPAEPKQERAKRTREQILAAAARTFEDVGYAAARLDDVARDAQVTKGALYFHFRSKADLARAVLEAHHARWAEIVREVTTRGSDPLTALVALSFAIAANYRTNQVARAGVRLGNEYRLVDAELPRPFVGWVARLTELLQAAEAEGLLAPGVDCAAAARSIVAAYFGVQEMSARLAGGRDVAKRLREWWQLFLPALTDEERSRAVLARVTDRGTLTTPG